MNCIEVYISIEIGLAKSIAKPISLNENYVWIILWFGCIRRIFGALDVAGGQVAVGDGARDLLPGLSTHDSSAVRHQADPER